MTSFSASKLRRILRRCTFLVTLIFPVSALANTWQLQAGAESPDRGRQELAFLPNEVWMPFTT